ncbi:MULTISPECIES: DUF1652 domain-containing protein [Pseudomonas]|uniref:DUF1652 domain-containing protein n=1 Tax=Pseudomonas TaxID=286 RepID=UPI000D6F28D0|nr:MULTISPECIES: DUF1652 domain-containing protein [unclassified Pseudomonas]MED5607453.1 DUF1652 domain-containing protein [Pseudomonas sp. JH-2]PWU31615.1 hypothetical protein DK254_03830 [Pseudomonas sp. RW407]
MQTYLQAKRILEDSFAPYGCRCTLEADGSMTVQLLAPNSTDVELTVPKIPRQDWNSLRAVARLALELRQTLDLAILQKDRPASAMHQEAS